MNWDRQEWLRNIATIGVAMAIAGSIRYELQGELLLMSKILLIGGGVVILAALVIGYRSIFQFFSRRSSRLERTRRRSLFPSSPFSGS